MSRDPSLYLEDILEACEKIQAYTEGKTRASFEEDSRTVEAVAWNLAIIGEAVKQLPPDTTRKAPSIEWRKIAGLRDVLVHAYFGIDHEIVWDVVENKVPELQDAVDRIRGNEPAP